MTNMASVYTTTLSISTPVATVGQAQQRVYADYFLLVSTIDGQPTTSTFIEYIEWLNGRPTTHTGTMDGVTQLPPATIAALLSSRTSVPMSFSSRESSTTTARSTTSSSGPAMSGNSTAAQERMNDAAKGLSKGAIAGLALASLVAMIMLVAMAIICMRRHHRARPEYRKADAKELSDQRPASDGRSVLGLCNRADEASSLQMGTSFQPGNREAVYSSSGFSIPRPRSLITF